MNNDQITNWITKEMKYRPISQSQKVFDKKIQNNTDNKIDYKFDQKLLSVLMFLSKHCLSVNKIKEYRALLINNNKGENEGYNNLLKRNNELTVQNERLKNKINSLKALNTNKKVDGFEKIVVIDDLHRKIKTIETKHNDLQQLYENNRKIIDENIKIQKSELLLQDLIFKIKNNQTVPIENVTNVVLNNQVKNFLKMNKLKIGDEKIEEKYYLNADFIIDNMASLLAKRYDLIKSHHLQITKSQKINNHVLFSSGLKSNGTTMLEVIRRDSKRLESIASLSKNSLEISNDTNIKYEKDQIKNELDLIKMKKMYELKMEKSKDFSLENYLETTQSNTQKIFNKQKIDQIMNGIENFEKTIIDENKINFKIDRELMVNKSKMEKIIGIINNRDSLIHYTNKHNQDYMAFTSYQNNCT